MEVKQEIRCLRRAEIGQTSSFSILPPNHHHSSSTVHQTRPHLIKTQEKTWSSRATSSNIMTSQAEASWAGSIKQQRLFRLFDALGRPTPQQLVDLMSQETSGNLSSHDPQSVPEQGRWSEFAQDLCGGPAAQPASVSSVGQQEMSLAYRPQKMDRKRDQEMINVPSGIEFVEDEINKALRAEGEKEIKLPIVEYMDNSCDPPVSVYDQDRGHPVDLLNQLHALLDDLKVRKPQLWSVVNGCLTDHEARVPLIARPKINPAMPFAPLP